MWCWYYPAPTVSNMLRFSAALSPRIINCIWRLDECLVLTYRAQCDRIHSAVLTLVNLSDNNQQVVNKNRMYYTFLKLGYILKFQPCVSGIKLVLLLARISIFKKISSMALVFYSLSKSTTDQHFQLSSRLLTWSKYSYCTAQIYL